MVNYCVCWGCTNSSLSGHRVHRFPNRKNAALLRAWVRFVQLKRLDFNTASATKNAVVCGAHFKPEDYSPGDLMEFNMGCRSKQAVRLSPGAVPSISTTSPRPLLAAAPGPAAGERHGQGADRDSARHELRTPATMSIEYTIDIQLTELGYPDILQSSVRETPCHSTSPHDSPSHTPTSLSPTPVQRLLARGQTPLPGKEAVKQTSDVEQATLPAPDTCTLPSPAPGPAPNEQVIKVTDDSGDSEVSDIYEEEEDDDDDDDEEEDDEEGGLNNESSHSGGHRCSVCDLQLPSKFKLQDHMNLHTGARPYCCAECGKRFCQIYNYRVHLRTHAQTKVDRLHCRVCLISFKSQEELRAHLSKNHLEDEFYECDFCKRVFTSLKACEYHVQLHKCSRAVVCDVCGRSFSTPKSLARHQRVTCHRNFKCTDCTKVFTRKNALLKHSFTHLGLLPYTCIRCNCHFRLAKLYRKHKCQPERIHCVACLREFPSQRDFQQHKKDTGCWGNQEPKGDEIRCLECGQRFDTPEELKKHAGAHQRVLNCAECGKGFRSALLLMSHMGGHAGNSPCLCQSCGLGFPHQQNYDSHLKTCGQTPQPASAPKRRQASHISSTKTKKVDAKPNPSNLNSSNPNSSNPNPANPTNTAAVNNSAALVNGSSTSPGLVTGGISADSAQSDGLWKLTLDAQPPPGVKLVVFLPVCPTQTDGQTHSPAISPAPQGPPQNVLLHLSNEHSHASLQDGPLNLVTGIKQDPDWEAPLDLSHKCSPALGNTSLPSIKAEPGEFEISSKADRTECKNSDAIKTEDDPMDTSRLIMDVKEEPQSPGPVTDPWSSTSCQLAEKEIKMEVDMSCPTEGK